MGSFLLMSFLLVSSATQIRCGDITVADLGINPDLVKEAEKLLDVGKGNGSCYGKSNLPSSVSHYVVREYAVNSTGDLCYTLPRSSDIAMLFDKHRFETGMASLKENFCPHWQDNKDCIQNHLLDKCKSAEERLSVFSSSSLGLAITLHGVICEQNTSDAILDIFRRAAKSNLWGCLSSPAALRKYDDCTKETEGDPFYEFFREFRECTLPLIPTCVNEQILTREEKEAKKKEYYQIWNDMVYPLTQAFVSFWDGLELKGDPIIQN